MSIPVQAIYAAGTTHAPTQLQTYNDTHQQEHQSELSEPPNDQSETTTTTNKDRDEEKKRLMDLRNAVSRTNDAHRPDNTKLAYTPKH
jgi:hypothetical protein